MPAIALLIDFDGVVRRWGRDDACIEPDCGLPIGAIRQVAFAPDRRGETTDAAWRAGALQELLRRFPGSSAHEAIARWSSSVGALDFEVLDVLSRCRPDLRVVLATNATSRLGNDLQTLGLAERFYAVANSSELGAEKPSVAYFLAALHRAGVRSSDALFVDDSLVNVHAAAGLGITAHHFTGHESLSDFLYRAGALSENDSAPD